MSRPEPLFGPVPVQSSVTQVENVCVRHYNESATRPFIWEGFEATRSKAVGAGAPGALWVSGDFVVDVEDPESAQVHFRVPATVERDDKLLDVLGWMNHDDRFEQLSCNVSSLVEFPPDDPQAPLVQEFAERVMEAFSLHGPSGKKGFPIIPLP